MWLPLVYHGAYGLALTLGWVERDRRPPRLSSAQRWQRITGATALVFIIWHTWQIRLRLALGTMDGQDVYNELAATLSSTAALGIPVVALAYVVGMAATTSHLAVGAFCWASEQGFTRTRARARGVFWACAVSATLVFGWGLDSVVYFATGSNLLLSPAASRSAN